VQHPVNASQLCSYGTDVSHSKIYFAIDDSLVFYPSVFQCMRFTASQAIRERSETKSFYGPSLRLSLRVKLLSLHVP
jgi:hypothetical protein